MVYLSILRHTYIYMDMYTPTYIYTYTHRRQVNNSMYNICVCIYINIGGLEANTINAKPYEPQQYFGPRNQELEEVGLYPGEAGLGGFLGGAFQRFCISGFFGCWVPWVPLKRSSKLGFYRVGEVLWCFSDLGFSRVGRTWAVESGFTVWSLGSGIFGYRVSEIGASRFQGLRL